ncbi:hypothetical protein OKW24_000948 [Peribacillus simplex]|nr:hypothetical protein [Peribacillus simplex]
MKMGKSKPVLTIAPRETESAKISNLQDCQKTHFNLPPDHIYLYSLQLNGFPLYMYLAE